MRDLFSVELSDMNGLHERMNDACATMCYGLSASVVSCVSLPAATLC